MNDAKPSSDPPPSPHPAGPPSPTDPSNTNTNTNTANSPNASLDVERTASTPHSATVHDPYQLRDGVLSEAQLAGLRQRKGTGKGNGRGGLWKGGKAGRELERYQMRQNDLIPALLKPMGEHTEDAQAEEDAARLPVKIAIYASLYANFGLCILQLYAALSSASLSLLATGIDSLFDIGSNVLLFWLHRKAAKLDSRKWPVGGARLECVGNCIYGFLMGAVNLVVVVESARSLITKQGNDLQKFHLPSIVAVAVATGVKLLLFLYSTSLRHKSSQVQVLWEDHRNDLFLNGFGIIMSTGGSKIVWWLDPMGAIIIGLGIITSWTLTIAREFALLAGRAAPHEFLQLITYKAATWEFEYRGEGEGEGGEGQGYGKVQRVDTVRAYHSGPNYFVEIDIVMDGATPLRAAHDAGQALQDAVEALPGVERAFVHVDWEWEHTPEHRKAAKRVS